MTIDLDALAYRARSDPDAAAVLGDALQDRIAGRRVIVSCSGGKDSAATSLHLLEMGIAHDRVFADTGWEHPKVYEYLRGELTRVIGPIHEVRNLLQWEDLVRKKAIFPDRTKQFCTTDLKLKPIRKYRDTFDEDIVNVIGIRRQESVRRRKAVEWEWSHTMDAEVWRPILHWTMADVVAIHKRHGLAPNPLYLMGASRVGCWPCINSRKAEIKLIAETDPDRIDRVRALEAEVNVTATERAAAKGEDLQWARSLFSAHVGRNGHRPMPIDEAVAWAKTASPAERGKKERAQQVELFASETDTCGEWGLCEPHDQEDD